LVFDSVIGNAEVFAHSEDDQKEYEALHPLVAESEDVHEEKAESASEDDQDIMDIPDDIADVLPTRKKGHRMVTGGSEECSTLGEVQFLNVTMC
jgi:hypothetical protein